MAKKQAVTKKHGKERTTAKAHRRAKRHVGPKPALELTNYLLESHPEFGN